MVTKVLLKFDTSGHEYNPQPIVKDPCNKYPYYFVRSTQQTVELLVVTNNPEELKEHFPSFVAMSPVTDAVDRTLFDRYSGWGLSVEKPDRNYPDVQDVIFFVPCEDGRPIIVDANTPRYEVLRFPHFDGVALLRVRCFTIDSIMRYWPDSFCHQKP